MLLETSSQGLISFCVRDADIVIDPVSHLKRKEETLKPTTTGQ